MYTVLDDGTEAAVTAYATSDPVTVPANAALDAPRNAIAVLRGRGLVVFWSPPRSAYGLDGYRVLWRSCAPCNQTVAWYSFDVGNVQSYTLEEARTNQTYQVEVEALNVADQAGRAAGATILTAAPSPIPFQIAAPSAGTTVGGEITVPITLTASPPAQQQISDYVTLTVQGAPRGVTAEPIMSSVNLLTPIRPAIRSSRPYALSHRTTPRPPCPAGRSWCELARGRKGPASCKS